TQNPLVHQDLCDATLKLPIEQAVQIVPKAKQWLESPYHNLFPEKMGEFILRLSTDEHGSSALELARLLLALSRDRKEAEINFPEAQPRFDAWQYAEIINTLVPNLLAVARNQTLEMLCDLL